MTKKKIKVPDVPLGLKISTGFATGFNVISLISFIAVIVILISFIVILPIAVALAIIPMTISLTTGLIGLILSVGCMIYLSIKGFKNKLNIWPKLSGLIIANFIWSIFVCIFLLALWLSNINNNENNETSENLKIQYQRQVLQDQNIKQPFPSE